MKRSASATAAESPALLKARKCGSKDVRDPATLLKQLEPQGKDQAWQQVSTKRYAFFSLAIVK